MTDSQQRVTILFRGVGKIIYTPSHELLFEKMFPHKTQERNLSNEVMFIKIGESKVRKIRSYGYENGLKEKKGKNTSYGYSLLKIQNKKLEAYKNVCIYTHTRSYEFRKI